MAPAAVSTVTISSSPNHNFLTQLFEGPEKKLVVRFAPLHCANPSTPNQSSRNAHSPSQTLRSLPPHHIDAILVAAKCTILSTVSNSAIDAYLLSESSMFISDFDITLKTCGTTTLLRALPVIMHLVADTLALRIVSVQFSRVAYLFPEEQRYPHDSFDHEVTYLNYILSTKGEVFQAASTFGSQWYTYFVRLSPSAAVAALHSEIAQPPILRNDPISLHEQQEAFEVSMFDLDPCVMAQFMFHDRPYMIGSDDFRSPVSQDITLLLGDYQVADGYNFAPCGYSLNALQDRSYYTIHVSPEPEASYVSFETTANVPSLPSLLAAVIKFFRPGRFTLSSFLLHARGGMQQAKSKLPWKVVTKILSPEYFFEKDPEIFQSARYPDCVASVGSFQQSGKRSTKISVHVDGLVKNNALEVLVISVGVKHGARIGGASILQETCEKFFQSEDHYRPKYFVDLMRVAQNWLSARQIAPNDVLRLRYAVRSNAHDGILALLSCLDLDFEVTDPAEIDLLIGMGVSREQMILVTPVLTVPMISRFSRIGMVALFEPPSEVLRRALSKANVQIELRVVETGVADLRHTLCTFMSCGLDVASIAVDMDPDVEQPLDFDSGCIREYVENVCDAVAETTPRLRRDVIIHVGELLPAGGDQCLNEKVCELRKCISGLPPRTRIGLDASRAILAESVSLMTRIVGRRGRNDSSSTNMNAPGRLSYSYYLSDGAYGAFSSVLMSPRKRGKSLNMAGSLPFTKTQKRWKVGSKVSKPREKASLEAESLAATIYGPTCDALDCLGTGNMPVLDVGDSLLFPNMAVYSSSSITAFNGFGYKFDVSYVVPLAGTWER